MAQTTRSTTKRKTSTSRSTGRSSGGNSRGRSSRSNARGSSARGNSTSTRGRSSSSRSNSTRATRSRSRNTGSNGAIGKAGEKVTELASKAKPQATTVRRTSRRVSNLASKAKTPLVAGGAALAGLAGGVALKNRTESKRSIKGFRALELPKSLKNVDLQQVIEAGRRVRSIGEQVGEVADTAEKTRKKHK
jgi:hypothetical protein